MRTEKLIKKLHTEQAPQTKPKINFKAKARKETKNERLRRFYIEASIRLFN